MVTLSDATTLAEMPMYYGEGIKHAKRPIPARVCVALVNGRICGVKLSRYNVEPYCFSCQERRRTQDDPTEKPKTFWREAKNIVDEHAAVLQAAAAMGERFTARDIAPVVNLTAKVVAAHLLRAEKTGQVARAGMERVRYRGSRVTEQDVIAWRVTR